MDRMIGYALMLVLMASVYVDCTELEVHSSQNTYAHLKWNYADLGPRTWLENFETCGGNQQSPIDINTSQVTNVVPSIWHNYNEVPYPADSNYTILNNGHALQMNLPPNTRYRLKKGNDLFIPRQVHIHFGTLTKPGSEHKLNGKHRFAEIHIVHENSNSDRLDSKHGLLVIGMFVDTYGEDKTIAHDPAHYHRQFRHKISKRTDNFIMPNPEGKTKLKTSFAMKKLTKFAKDLQHPGNEVKIAAFQLNAVLPFSLDKRRGINMAVNYQGSLTTPPCSEIVDWVVITGKTLLVSEEEAKKLLKVLNSENNPMHGNCRNVQPLNGRKLSAIGI